MFHQDNTTPIKYNDNNEKRLQHTGSKETSFEKHGIFFMVSFLSSLNPV